MGRLPLKRGETRKIDGCQFLTISFINNGLTFFTWALVNTFETLRDRTTICQTKHGHV
jgi:hypothetical protein